MKQLLLILILLNTSSVFASWQTKISATGETEIIYSKGEPGEKNIASIIAKMKASGQLNQLNSVHFPNFSQDDDYQKRIKLALLILAPEEAQKIFIQKEHQPWAHYNKLESKLGDAYTELAEFKDVKAELAKVGYMMGPVRAEKFCYSDLLGSPGDEPRLFGMHPQARIMPIIPEAEPATNHDLYISVTNQVEIEGKHYLKFKAYPSGGSKLQLKGIWSDSLEAHVISTANIYQHDGNDWQLVQEVNESSGKTLSLDKNNLQEMLLPVTKLKPANTTIVLKLKKLQIHSEMKPIK